MSTPTTERPMAVVTGASSGIGYELARQFCQHGYDVMIAAQDDGIRDASDRLSREGRTIVQPVQVDLAHCDGVDQVLSPSMRNPGTEPWVTRSACRCRATASLTDGDRPESWPSSSDHDV